MYTLLHFQYLRRGELSTWKVVITPPYVPLVTYLRTRSNVLNKPQTLWTNTMRKEYLCTPSPSLIAKSSLHRWRQCFDTKAKWNLLNSTIGTIFGTVLDRLINDSKMKELVKNSSYRRSYSIMNVGMADFASCRYDAGRMHHSSSRHTPVA
jgi:hypothetical protein